MKEMLRTRLLNGLQADQLPDLITILAPAGYGKTTFTRQLLTWCGYPGSYITLHPLQGDSRSLLDACIHVFAGHLSDTAVLNRNDIETARDLCRILARDLKHPHILVLDDVHLLKGSPSAEKWLAEILAYLPSQLHLVLVGREPPALPFSQLLAEQRLLVFNREDLCVTIEELQTIRQHSETELDRIIKRMDGWITGIQLALDSKETSSGELPDKDIPQERFNLLVQADFERFSPDRRIFLLQTALAETVESRLCRDVFGQTGWMAHLQALEKGHFYLHREEQAYRYHDLLRGFLQDYAKTNYPHQFKQWHQQLADWFKQEDQPGAVIWHSLQAGDIEQARDYADDIAKEWHITGFWSGLLQIRKWLGNHAGSRLQLMCGMILTDWNRLEESNQLLQDAYQVFVAQEDGLNQCRALLQLASNRFAHGDYQTVTTLAERVIHHVASSPALEAWAGRMLAWTKMELGAYDDALEDFEAILNNFSENERGFGRASILQDMSLAYFGTGQLEDAGRCLLEGLALRRQMQDNKEIALGLNNLAYYYHLQSQYDEAQIALDEAFDLIARRDDRIAALVRWTQADLYRDVGQFDNALMAYEEGLVLALNHHHIYLNLLLNLIRMRCWQGQWQDARHILSEAEELELPEQALLAQRRALMVALLDAREEGLPAHIDVIQTRLDRLQAREEWLTLVQHLGLYLALAIRDDDSTIQADAWQRIQSVPPALLQAFAADCLHQSGLRQLNHLKQLPVLAELLQKLQDVLPEIDEQDRRDLSVALTQIDLQTLGDDAIRVNSLLMPAKAWTVTFARELFYYLHFQGAKSKAELGLVFWAEHDTRQLRNALHNNLKRIRKAIPDLIHHAGDVYAIHPAFQIRSDYVDFLSFVQRASLLPYHDARCADLLKRAYDLYQGDFLPDFHSDWVIQMRDTAQATYLKCLIDLASCHCEHLDYTNAIDYLEEGIALHPYDERCYRGVMRCYMRLGQNAEVQKTFDRLATCLAEDLDLSPSDETWDLLQQIL